MLSSDGIQPSHPDYALVTQLESVILRHGGGYEKFREDIPQLLRRAIDEVIDSARSNRFTLIEIEKTEKTYIGTKIEILLRNYLGMNKGKVLDLSIDGIEVDIKNTIGSNWTIPSEAMGHPCILLKAQESTSLCSFGIIVIRDEILNPGRNRDGKRTISQAGMAHVHWLLKDEPYPENFWEKLDTETRQEIVTPRGGTERLANLFRRVQNRPISRLLVQAVAQQDDYMKRIRRNGGARDVLAPEGIAILWGQKDKLLIHKLGVPACGPDEFISFKPGTAEQIQLLRDAHHID
jgi:Restriction endonuclease NaeI